MLRAELLRTRNQLGRTQNSNLAFGGHDRAPRVHGQVKIEAIYQNGQSEILHESRNKVVELAETMLPFMSLGLRQIDYIELGDPSPATPPDFSDTGMQQTTGQRKSISGSVSQNVGTYEALWATGEGNGFSYTEAGLFTDPFGAGTIFARKTFDPIPKTSAFSLKFTWSLVFSVDDNNDGCSGVALLGPSTVVGRYQYIATGGETDIIVPLDFTPGTYMLDVFMNNIRLYDTTEYIESTIGASRGIVFIGFVANPGDRFYFVQRRLA